MTTKAVSLLLSLEKWNSYPLILYLYWLDYTISYRAIISPVYNIEMVKS